MLSQDQQIASQLDAIYGSRETSLYQGLAIRNKGIHTLLNQGASIKQLFSYISKNGGVDFAFVEISWRDTDGEESTLTVNKASETEIWPMGTNYWIRDNAIIADILLNHKYEHFQKDWNRDGKKLLLSALTIISSNSQLERFRSIISGKTSAQNAHHWPHIFLSISENINAKKKEGWMHKQDAWQILAYVTLKALHKGAIVKEELTKKHQEFLSLISPFLETVKFWECRNGGSWEEVEAVRTSVISWETALLKKINQTNWLKSTISERLYEKGISYLSNHYSAECPTEDAHSPLFRDADATLIYLLQNESSALIATHTQQSESDIFNQILSKVQTLESSLGLKRYLTDSYQGLDYFSPSITQQLNTLYQTPSGDSSGLADFIKRSEIIPSHNEAQWTHFLWQLSANCGKFYLKKRNKDYQSLQKHYFIKALGTITGENEYTIRLSNNKVFVEPLPALRIPECYNTHSVKEGTITYPSPHTPLYWAVAEAIKAFSLILEAETTL